MMMMRIFHRMFAQERNTCARMCMSRAVRCVYRTGKQYTGERESKATVQIELSFKSIISSLFNTIESRKKVAKDQHRIESVDSMFSQMDR